MNKSNSMKYEKIDCSDRIKDIFNKDLNLKKCIDDVHFGYTWSYIYNSIWNKALKQVVQSILLVSLQKTKIPLYIKGSKDMKEKHDYYE